MIDSTPPTIESLERALRVLEGRLNREIRELGGGRLDDMSNQSVDNSTDYSDDDQEKKIPVSTTSNSESKKNPAE